MLFYIFTVSVPSNKKKRVRAIYCRIQNSLVKRDFSYLTSFAKNKVLYESCSHLFCVQLVEILSREAFFFNFFKAEFSKEAQFLISSFLQALAALHLRKKGIFGDREFCFFTKFSFIKRLPNNHTEAILSHAQSLLFQYSVKFCFFY